MFLKQNAVYTFRHGPFLDEDDGKTAETGLTIEDSHVRVSKAGANFIDKAETSNSTHDEAGFYVVALDGTDTNTVGELLIAVHVSGALPVFKTFQVVEEVIFDSLFAASAAAFDANQRVDVSKIEGSDATDQINAACDTALSDYDAPTKAEMDSAHSTTDGLITAVDNFVDTEVAAIKSVVDDILVDTAVIGAAGAGLTDLGGMSTGMKAEVNAEADTALSDYDGPTKAEMDTAHGLLATEAKQDIIDTNIDQIETVLITNAAGADIAADIIAVKAETALIVADTNELQTDDVPGLIAALNNISTAQVNAEVDTALADIHLDHLLAADYDPASKPGTATALLNELVESDSGVSRFTTNALEQGPSGGGGGDATEAKQDTIIAAVKTNAAGVDVCADIISLKAETSLIVADTNELQVDDIPGKIAALNDLSAAQVNAQVDTALADYDGPTKAEMDSAHSTTDGLITAVDNFVDTEVAAIKSVVDDILIDTSVIGTAGAGLTDLGGMSTGMKAEVNAECDTALSDYDAPTKAEMDAMWTTTQTESYAADGDTATPAQLLYMILCAVSEFTISGTTITGKKLNGSTTAMTWTLDDASDPTSRTRAT